MSDINAGTVKMTTPEGVGGVSDIRHLARTFFYFTTMTIRLKPITLSVIFVYLFLLVKVWFDLQGSSMSW